MMRALLGIAFLILFSIGATAQCPGPSCKMQQRSKEVVPGGVGGSFGAAGGYVGAPPTGGYTGIPSGGGYAGPPGGGYLGPPGGGGYVGPRSGYAGPPGGGYSPSPQGGGYGGGANNGIVYQNQPDTQISNYCVTDFGACAVVQQVGTSCTCMDAGGNYYNGVAQ